MPLDDARRLDLIKWGTDQGLGQDDIFKLLDRAEVDPSITGGVPTKAQPIPLSQGPPSEDIERRITPRTGMQSGGKLSLTMPQEPSPIVRGGSSVLGQIAARGLAAAAGLGPVAQLVASVGGAMAGDALGQPLSGQKEMDWPGTATVGGLTALTEGTMRGGGYVGARAGTVGPEAAKAAQGDLSLLKPVPEGSYEQLGSQIAQHAQNLPQTPEHFGYNMLTRARGQIDGRPFVQSMMNTVRTNVDEPVSRLIENKTRMLANSLQQRLGPEGAISAEGLDDWIRTNLTEPASRVYEKGAGSAWQERLASLRDQLSPQLYKVIGGGAADLQAATAKQLNIREGVTKFLPEQTSQNINLVTPARLREALSDSSTGIQLRQRLGAYDAANNTDFLNRSRRLAMRSEWTAGEKQEVEQILGNLPAIRAERIGLVRASSRKLGRALTKGIKTVGSATAGATSYIRGRTMVAPEEMFPGMTNAPAQENQ